MKNTAPGMTDNHRQRQLLAALLQGSVDGIIVQNLQGIILVWNHGATDDARR